MTQHEQIVADGFISTALSPFNPVMVFDPILQVGVTFGPLNEIVEMFGAMVYTTGLAIVILLLRSMVW